MYSGLLSVYHHGADMEVDVPIDLINLDHPDLSRCLANLVQAAVVLLP